MGFSKKIEMENGLDFKPGDKVIYVPLKEECVVQRQVRTSAVDGTDERDTYLLQNSRGAVYNAEPKHVTKAGK